MTDTVHGGSAETRPLIMDIGTGVVAGLAGGLVFGALMAVMAMLPMIGMAPMTALMVGQSMCWGSPRRTVWCRGSASG